MACGKSIALKGVYIERDAFIQRSLSFLHPQVWNRVDSRHHHTYQAPVKHAVSRANANGNWTHRLFTEAASTNRLNGKTIDKRFVRMDLVPVRARVEVDPPLIVHS